MDKPTYRFTVDGATTYIATLETVDRLGVRFVIGSTSLVTCILQLTEEFLYE